MLRKMPIAALTLLAVPLLAPRAEATVVQASAGMYALTSAIVDGGTCTGNDQLEPFSFFYYAGASGSGSEFYYLSTPGSDADTVTMPKTPAKTVKHWTGKMDWTLSPYTFAKPHINTDFDVTFTFVEARLFFLNGTFTLPTSTGGTCTENVAYTAVETGS